MSIARTPAEVATLTMGKEPTTAEERAEWTRIRDAVESDRAARDEVTVTLPSGQTLRVWVGTSDFDGSALVQIDTEDGDGNVRVFVNDSGDPVYNENPETGAYVDNSRECDRCGDEVATLSTDDLCDGCVAEDATAPRCSECGERVEAGEIGAGWGMCASCVHNARRSGWNPGE